MTSSAPKAYGVSKPPHGSPITLALRSLPRGKGTAGVPRALLLEALHSRVARFLSHPLFTNLVWREDEWNFLKKRNHAERTSEAFAEREQRWNEVAGF